ncbi:MAG: CvpA family protein [Sphingobacteriales bacterium]|nr:MAG: CvpA family protein [Sphingobacteriales bacterium]
MVLDVIGISLIILFFIRGYIKGFIVAAFSVLAILLGIVISLKLSEKLAMYLLEQDIISSGWAPVLSYVVLFISVILLVNLVAKLIEKSLQAVMLGWANRAIGGLLYTFLAAVLWSSLLWLGNRLNVIKPETIAASKTYTYIEPVAPWFFDKVGVLWPMAKDVFGDLEVFFSDVNQNLSEDVDTDR